MSTITDTPAKINQLVSEKRAEAMELNLSGQALADYTVEMIKLGYDKGDEDGYIRALEDHDIE